MEHIEFQKNSNITMENGRFKHRMIKGIISSMPDIQIYQTYYYDVISDVISRTQQQIHYFYFVKMKTDSKVWRVRIGKASTGKQLRAITLPCP